MHRTSRILALTTLLFAAGAALFFTKAAALPYKVAYPVLLLAVAVFCLRRKTLLPVGAALLLSALGDAAGAKGLFIPQMLFFALAHGAYIRYFLCAGGLPARPAAWLLPAALLALLFAGVVPRVLDPDALQRAPVSRGVCRMVPLRGPAVRFFRQRDRMGTLRRARSLPDLCRDDYLLCRAILVLPLCRQCNPCAELRLRKSFQLTFWPSIVAKHTAVREGVVSDSEPFFAYIYNPLRS